MTGGGRRPYRPLGGRPFHARRGGNGRGCLECHGNGFGQRGVEQQHVIALQARLAVGIQNKLGDGLVDRPGGADMQQGLRARPLQAQLRMGQRGHATHRGGETEALRGRVLGRVQHGNRGVQWLPQEGTWLELAQAEGRGGAGMAQTQQEAGGLDVHAAQIEGITPLIPARKPLTLGTQREYWHDFWFCSVQQDQRPHQGDVDQCDHHRRAAHVLGALDELVVLE